jgi:putative MATE family efflux protein
VKEVIHAKARFLEGSIMRHVVVMTLTSAIGLMSFFFVDFADLYYLSLLNNTEITAAIGYAGTIGFINLSMGLGSAIAAAALVARNLGAGDEPRAKAFANSALLFSILISSFYTVLIAIFADPLLRLLGATGGALAQAKLFVWTLSPGFVLMAIAISCSFILRGLGDARRSMYITLSMAIITAIIDPIFIFTLDLKMQGAALANIIAQAFGVGFGLYALNQHYAFLHKPDFAGLRRDLSAIWAIAFPAILTQLATPVAGAYTTYAMSQYGDEVVAGNTIVGRLVPVAFGVIFSLSGAVGPIIGQNFGAQKYDRVRQALMDGLTFSALYTLVVCALLFVFRAEMSHIFSAGGRAEDIVIFFCTYAAISWVFAGAQFVSNAAFNNLGRPTLSTWYNWTKATLGTVPFAMAGAHIAGPEGILAGIAVGSVIFGIASTWHSFRIVRSLKGAKS